MKDSCTGLSHQSVTARPPPLPGSLPSIDPGASQVPTDLPFPSLPCTHSSRVAVFEDLSTGGRPGFSVPHPSLTPAHRMTLNKLSASLSFAHLTS